MIPKWLPYVAAFVLLVSLALLLIFHRPQRHFDGRITLDPQQKIPYGCFVAYQLLALQFPKAITSISKAAPGRWKLPGKDTSGTAIFIVIDYFNPSPEELNSLTVFAQKGNTVFISALQMSDRAQHFFGVQQNDVYSRYGNAQSNESLSFRNSFHTSLDSSVFEAPNEFAYPGISYDNRFVHFDSMFTYPLGSGKNGMNNLLAIHTVKGTVFLHSAPITFTNFFLLYNHNYAYLEHLMSLLPENTKFIIWDEYFKYREIPDNEEKRSVLFVLLKYENFRWAFWLTVVAAALYLVTEVKRKQRLVPEHQPPVNDSLDFVSTVGRLYYERGDHKNLADKLTLFFLDNVRTKYKLQTSSINAEFSKALSQKSNVPLALISELTDALVELKLSPDVSQMQVMNYYRLLENFYRNES